MSEFKDRDEVEVAAQCRFGEDGQLEVDEQVETDFGDWGLDLDEQERETRVEVEAASEFGVDDRSETVESQSEQETLFVDVEDDQQTLAGEQAAGQSRWD